MKLYCPALLSGKYIPLQHAHPGVRGGKNVSLPISWKDVPDGTRSFVLTMIDHHPVAHDWLHWLMINIPASVRELPTRTPGDRTKFPGTTTELRNTWGDVGYGGPEPPRGSGPHEYELTLYALSLAALSVGPFATLDETLDDMAGAIIAQASVTGIYQV